MAKAESKKFQIADLAKRNMRWLTRSIAVDVAGTRLIIFLFSPVNRSFLAVSVHQLFL